MLQNKFVTYFLNFAEFQRGKHMTAVGDTAVVKTKLCTCHQKLLLYVDHHG